MTDTVPRPRRKERVADDDSIVFSIRLPGPIYNQINDISKQEERTLNAQITVALREWLAGRGKPRS